jgi:hypothetical protein
MSDHHQQMSASNGPPSVPLVVQLGFAGARTLFDPQAYPKIRPEEFEAALQDQLTARLRSLFTELRLTERHFICGLSQLAIGADTIFTRSLKALGWPQRFLLPQNREDFLAAADSKGRPDFDSAQREIAHELFRSPHAIQERVVSDSPDRHTRFRDVNRELVRISDVLVSLVGSSRRDKPGGTQELIEEAKLRPRALLELSVDIDDEGQPRLRDAGWHNPEAFEHPALPHELAGLQAALTGIPTMTEYCAPLKQFASKVSKGKRRFFRLSALIVIGAHLLATGCAVIAMQLAHGAAIAPYLLGTELFLLAMGLWTHHSLHRSHLVKIWAMARLVAEMARAGLALDYVEGHLGHLFSLPLPESLRPLLRTLNVLHLRDARAPARLEWEERRTRYVEKRLTEPKGGQINYYDGKLRQAKVWQAVANWTFHIGSVLAIASSLGELALFFGLGDLLPAELHDFLRSNLGPLAIISPVVAVGALSLAAAFDLEARAHTYAEMHEFLKSQKKQLMVATSERAFHALALETEERLLGEIAHWYSRRAFINVT